MRFNVLSVTGLAALFLAPVISGYAIASPAEDSSRPPSRHDLKILHNLEDAFVAIQSVPDEVCKAGDDAARKWVKEHFKVKDDSSDLDKRQLRDILQCGWELANNLPIGRAKKLLELLGGWRKAAKLIRDAAKDPSKRAGALKELIDLITGIPSLKKECWDDFRD